MLKSEFDCLLIANTETKAMAIGTKVKQITGFDDLTFTDCISTLWEKATGTGLKLVLCCLEPGDNRWATIRRLISNAPERIACIALLEKADPKSVVDALANGAIDALPMRHLEQLPLALVKAKFHLLERTGWHTAQRQFSHSEARFKAIIENSFNCFVIYNEKNVLTYMSPGVKRYFGFEPSDLLGQSVTAFIHPEDREKRNKEIIALREGRKKVAEVVQRAFTKSGQTIWIRAVISDQRHIPGVEGFVSNITDITPLITAQQQQEKLVHKLGERVKEQSLLYQAIAMLHVPAQEAEPDKVMASLARMLPSGWQYPEHTQASIELDDGRIFSTRNFKNVTNTISATFNTNSISGTITVGYTKEFPALDEGPFLTEERNLINNLATIVASFFEKKHVHDDLRLERTNLSALINNTEDLIWSVDRNLCLINANNAFLNSIRQFTGRQLKTGDSVLVEEFTGDILKRWIGYYNKALNGEPLKVEESYQVDDHTTGYSEIILHPIKEPGNKTSGIGCMSRDISEKKWRINQIEEQNKRLREVAWMQSHMVRAPVANILGLIAHLDLENLDNEKNQDIIKHLKAAGQQLDSAVREVVSKAEDSSTMLKAQ